MFNNGVHVQRRFVFGIVQSRFQGEAVITTEESETVGSNKPVFWIRTMNLLQSSPKAEREKETTGRNTVIARRYFDLTVRMSLLGTEIGNDLHDHLSTLFWSIASLCVEQSKIISMVRDSRMVYLYGEWCTCMVNGVLVWWMVYLYRRWCTCMVDGVLAWWMVYLHGGWCSRMVDGALVWWMV